MSGIRSVLQVPGQRYTRARVTLALLTVALPASSALSTQATNQAQPLFAHTAFSTLWERTDAPVATGTLARTWFWGPRPNSPGVAEEYREGTGGKRLVQYFDKSRMEINNPGADTKDPFFVTNGLLTVELISGRMQTGNNTFVVRSPSNTNVTGDARDPLAPSYADLAAVSSAWVEKRDPDRTGQSATATLSADGRVGQDASKVSVSGVGIVYYEKLTGHNIPRAMWEFLNSSGTVSMGGNLLQQRLNDPWFYASGLPISDPYWVRATISGKPTDVLVQAYERRVLTYVPTNPEGFRVEMGNIGQHYYTWRYPGAATPVLAPTQTPLSVPSALSRFAVDVVADTSPATLDAMRRAGAGAIRVYLSWKELEPSNVLPARYNWIPYDGKFKALSYRGLQPITVVLDCPTWACSRGDGPIRGERVSDFVEFMGALAVRYGKAPYNAHYWEFWNEPDSTTEGEIRYNWGTYGARYAAMLGAVRPAMKAADPNAKLVLGGIAYDNFQENGGPFVRRFVDDVLDAGGGRYLDVFNFHYYVQNVHWCSFTDKLKELRGKLTSRGLNLPIISTETGFTSDPELGSSEDMQSLYVAQVYAQSIGEGMLSTAWFIAKDFAPDVPGWGIFAESGLLDSSGVTKPSHEAYRIAVSQIGQRRPLRALGARESVTGDMRGYEFAPGSGQPGSLWVLWAWDLSTNRGSCGTAPAARDYIIPAYLAADVKGVQDMYGRAISTRMRSDGSLSFSLDAKPVYITWKP